jgi:signal peptidase I
MKAGIHPDEIVTQSLVEEILRSVGRVRLRVTGTSMVPIILPGDIVSVDRASQEQISPGDIALFSQHGKFLAHRVVHKNFASGDEESYVITRGDRLKVSDPPVPASQILGRVTLAERGNYIFRPAKAVKGWHRLTLGLLRTSGFATTIYLFLVFWRRAFIGKIASCQP